MAPTPGTVRRTKVIVDPGLQVSIARPLVLVLAVLALVHMGTTWFMGSLDPVEGPGSRGALQLGLLVSGVYFALVLVAAFLTIVQQTQRIAGPALVIERALRAMRHGDYGQRLSLRDKDHLKLVAEASVELQRHLAEERSGRVEFLTALDAALFEGDIAGARELVAEHAESVSKDADTAPSLRRSA